MRFEDLEKMIHYLDVRKNRCDVYFTMIELEKKPQIGYSALYASISKGNHDLVGSKNLFIYIRRFEHDDIHITINGYEYDKSFNTNNIFTTDYTVKTFLEAYKLVESTIQAFIA